MFRVRGRRRLTAAVAVGALAATTVGTLVASGAGTASAASLPQVNVAMDPHHLTVGGNLVSGAVTVKSTISGENEGDFALIHVNSGVTNAQFVHFMQTHPLDDPNEVSAVGSIVFDYAAPRGTSTVQTRLPAGRYFAVDTGGPSGPSEGLHAQFTIAPAKNPAVLPKASATVQSIEFGFRTPASLKQGSLVRFQNDGWLVHMIVGIHAKNDSDANKIVAALRKGDDQTAQKLATGFASFLDPASHGAVVQERLTAAKGSWILACFMSTQDGREHSRLGMAKLVHIN